MTWFFFEATNRELRTVPSGFGARRISNLTWTTQWAGKRVQAGDVLATVTFVGAAASEQLIAPPGCDGVVVRTFPLKVAIQAMQPSQPLLYLV
jgi:hypothetical protein